jgi:hypothetical protein
MSGLSSQLRGMDLVRWLDNQLGNTNELWSGRQASTILSREILNELTTCFQALEPHVKLKIIEAIPHLSPKLVQMVCQLLATISLNLKLRFSGEFPLTIYFKLLKTTRITGFAQLPKSI